jgi:hypothetical protein
VGPPGGWPCAYSPSVNAQRVPADMWLRETSTQWMDGTPDAVQDLTQERGVDHLPSAEA